MVKSPDEHVTGESKDIGDIEQPEQLEASTGSDPDYKRLARSILDADGPAQEAKMLESAANQNMGSFIPDLMAANLVKNPRNAESMYGKRLLRQITGYDTQYIQRNINIPEFAKDLQGNIRQSVKSLQEKGLVDESGNITADGRKLAVLSLYIQEIEHLQANGLTGEIEHKNTPIHGQSDDIRAYHQGDLYADIALKPTIHLAIRRGNKTLNKQNIRVYEGKGKGTIQVIYAVDASGSMRGDKIAMAKRAGVALAYKAIREHNKVGLLVFSTQVTASTPPTNNFFGLLEQLAWINTNGETNLASTIQKATELFTNKQQTKHLILLTDASPTSGDNPQQEALAQAACASAAGITISVIGIQVDEPSHNFARQLADIGKGNFYQVTNLEQLDTTVLMDYTRHR